jgi:hypothetical protein
MGAGDVASFYAQRVELWTLAIFPPIFISNAIRPFIFSFPHLVVSSLRREERGEGKSEEHSRSYWKHNASCCADLLHWHILPLGPACIAQFVFVIAAALIVGDR